MTSSALLLTSLLFLTACEKASKEPPRLFSDEELANLEARVLAEVKKSRSDCIRPEAVALWKPTSDLAACISECDVLDYGADHKKPIRRDELLRIATPEVAALDTKCGDLVRSAFERAAATRGCSPFQLGIDNDENVPSIIRQRLHLFHMLVRHARATDRASGARSLIAGLQASQDLGQGRTNGFTLITAFAVQSSMAQSLLELLADAQLTRSDLDALATSIDQLIASGPGLAEILQTDAVYAGFVYGLVPIKGSSWKVPGGRSESMSSTLQTSDTHDWRDVPGLVMLSALEREERLRTTCPHGSSYRQCFDSINAVPHIATVPPNVNLLKRPHDDSAASRARIKREFVDNDLAYANEIDTITRGVQALVPLVAVRLRIEVLRNGHCPTTGELDLPPYSILRAPSVLGDMIQVTPSDQGLRLDPPTWVREQLEKDRQAAPPFPPPPPAKVISVACP